MPKKKMSNAETMLLEKLESIDKALKSGNMSRSEKEDLRLERINTLNELELCRA
jgi:hypothetical protein